MDDTFVKKSSNPFNKSRIIKEALPVQYRYSSTVAFHLKTKEMIPVVQKIMEVMDDVDDNKKPDSVEILKNVPVNRRLLYRLKLDGMEYPAIIVKVKKLHKLRLRMKYAWMKYHRYGFAETANLITAANLGIEVPQVYGYGCERNVFGIVKKDVILLEDLGYDSIPILAFLEQNRNNPERCIHYLDQLIPILIVHYQSGCNNWDINHGSFVYVQRNGDWYPVVLDFEYVEYFVRPSLENLMFMAGQLAQHLPKWIDQQVYAAWANKLLDAVRISDADVRSKQMERFFYYYNSPVLPHKERRKIV